MILWQEGAVSTEFHQLYLATDEGVGWDASWNSCFTVGKMRRDENLS